MSAPHPPEPGDPTQLGPYRIRGRIGEGGQGAVYLGEAEAGKPVAVKLFHARFDLDSAARDDFIRELEVAKRVARFCTAQVLDFGIAGNRPYIVSEYVPGPSLHQVVNAEGPRSGSGLERLAVATATALIALHDAGIVHRDLKPQNVLLGPDGPRVIDFGIARALVGNSMTTSQVVGTPAYMAPEQLTAGPLGLAVDVFAWASTIAFAASGRPPFGNDEIPAVITRILNGEPRLDGIEQPLRDLLAGCLAKDPQRRPSAREILDRLVGSAVPPSVPPSVPFPVSPSGPPTGPVIEPGTAAGRAPRRGRWIAAMSATGAVVVTGVALAVALLPGGGVTPSQPVGAEVPVRTPVVSAAVPETAAPVALETGKPVDLATPSPRARVTRRPTTKPTAAPRPTTPATTTQRPTAKPTPRATATHRPPAKPTTAPKPTTSSRPPAQTEPPRPSPAPTQLVELGPGHFTEYCVSIGWEWVEYRETPQPGAYCVKNKDKAATYLTQSQRDAGCRWRFNDPHAFHRFKGKSNYCYAYR
ncbi:serine/threonine protein kinase [Sphaerimonospora cavernae]|uniref:Serine/threonine protein kinase n=1 Tax=Sphaerimonospora cavernae TaxID=1740611 RepID=A0ABV6U0D6_9ACTN